MEGWDKLRDLGAGGFGVVSLWKNSHNNRLLALKCCRINGDVISSKTKEDWRNEVTIMSKLNHPNIIKSHAVPEPLSRLSELPILCMEFCTKGDLRKELCKVENICGLPEESIRAILRDVKDGLEYLHNQSITHRDLKPENIVINEVPDPVNKSSKIVYKLIDLGFAKEWNQNSLSSTLVGTPVYFAPEFFMEKPKYTYSVDYWNFGLVCHEIVTGFRPFLPSMSNFLPQWVKLVQCKKHEDICIYEKMDGDIEYSSELFPENHISQPLKYALEKWLRIALEWDGTKRGRNRKDPNSLIIFSSLYYAINTKIVTIFCVKRLERLSYEIDESTLTGTLKQWIDRDFGMPVSNQLLLLPSGLTLEDNWLIHTHIDTDPKLVAMLYLIPKEEGVKLPSVEVLQSKHPIFVRRMLESPTDLLSYHTVKRTWANSVFFVQSVHDSYKAFIEAYSAKVLSLFNLSSKIMNQQKTMRSGIISLQSIIAFSKDSLKIDLQNIMRNQFHKLIDGNKGKEWESPYTPVVDDLERLRNAEERLSTNVDTRMEQLRKIPDYEEPGQIHCDNLVCLLNEGRKLYAALMRLPHEERVHPQDPSPMVQIIFQLWECIGKISKDESFQQHLMEVARVDNDLTKLMNELLAIDEHIKKIKGQIYSIHSNRQKQIWNLLKSATDNPAQTIQDIPPLLPERNFLGNNIVNIKNRIPMGWGIENDKSTD